MLRRLLNIASIVCLVACVVLMAIWVRSYHCIDQLQGKITGQQMISVDAFYGRLLLKESPVPYRDFPWTMNSTPIKSNMPFATQTAEVWDRRMGQGSSSPLGFAVYLSWPDAALMLPLWFLVLATGTLAMAFQRRWPWRFTLRSLFIATTFLAVVLGMITWMDRAWIGK
jgi:hypothetical protein